MSKVTTWAVIVSLVFALGTAGCSGGSGAKAPTIPDVLVAQVEQRDVPIYGEWLGMLDGIVNADIKTDPNTDLILAQSRETLAASQLPTEVTNYGVTVQKSVTAAEGARRLIEEAKRR